MTFGEVRRAVTTHGGVDHVFLLPVPTNTAEIADCAGIIVRITGYAHTVLTECCTCAVADPSMCPVIETFFELALATAEICAVVARAFHTDEHVEIVILDAEVIGCGVGPCHAERMVHVLVHAGLSAVDIGREFIYRCEATVFA